MTLPFKPRFPPISHQAEFLDVNARRAAFALFWEMGCGKTKALIDNIALLAIEDNLRYVLVLAPNGVHRNWHVEELPKHWPEDAPGFTSFAWDSEKAATKAHQQAFERFITGDTNTSVSILCMSYDALMTDAGKAASWQVIRNEDSMYILDESQRVKTPNAKRTKRVIQSSVYAKYRRIASGTPMDQPFDIYSQMRFLDANHWVRRLGIGSFTAFKAHFANWTQQMMAGGRSFPKLVSFRNLEQMQDSVAEISSRVLKTDVLDLPEKTYKRVYHELTPAQRKAYNQLRDEALTFLDSGQIVTAEMALVMQLRFAQITSGFLKTDDSAALHRFDPNPRARIFEEVLSDLTRPAIIWGQFVHDCEVAAECSRRAGRRPVIYNGARPGDSMDPFHRGEAEDIIANLSSSMIEGYTLNEADSTLYYSCGPKLIPRQQSEDRNHRIGQHFSVTYTDFLAERTLNTKNLERLQAKRSNTGAVLGDDPEELTNWLREALEDDH